MKEETLVRRIYGHRNLVAPVISCSPVPIYVSYPNGQASCVRGDWIATAHHVFPFPYPTNRLHSADEQSQSHSSDISLATTRLGIDQTMRSSESPQPLFTDMRYAIVPARSVPVNPRTTVPPLDLGSLGSIYRRASRMSSPHFPGCCTYIQTVTQ